VIRSSLIVKYDIGCDSYEFTDKPTCNLDFEWPLSCPDVVIIKHAYLDGKSSP